MMDSILTVVQESAAVEDISRVTKVAIVVGCRSGALPAALTLAFEVLSGSENGGLFRGAVLTIEERKVKARCRRCGLEYGEGAREEEGAQEVIGDREGEDGEVGLDTAAWAFVCPKCGVPGPEYLSGNELFIDHYEGE